MCNYARNAQRQQDAPTPEDIMHMAREHRAYGWSARPWGHWTTEQRDLYMATYTEVRA